MRVNQDPINNGRNQIFPAMRVDENGGINVIYVDNRNTFDSAQTYLSRSTDGGVTWRDFIVSDHKYKPKGIAGAGSGNQGDNIGITSGNNKLWPVWMDDFTGVYQVWTAPIDLSTIGINQISSSAPAGFELQQNYPNFQSFNKDQVQRSGFKQQRSYQSLQCMTFPGRRSHCLPINILGPESMRPGSMPPISRAELISTRSVRTE